MKKDLKHGYVHSNGIRMHYVEQGKGPLVLLCHGWPESWYSWRHQIWAIASAGYRVIAPDQRGYGWTDKPEETTAYDILCLAGDLIGLVNALEEEHAVLVGHDWGAMLGVTAALLRPDIFRALALLSVPYLPRQKVRPALCFRALSQERHFYQEYFQLPRRIEAELEADTRKALLGVFYTISGECRLHPRDSQTSFVKFEKATRFIDNLVIPANLPLWLTHADLAFYATEFERSGFKGPINWYRNIDRNWTLTPFLDGAKILQPTLFAAGQLDPVVEARASEYETLEKTVPNLVKKTLFPGAGHWIQQERAAGINKLLIAFLHHVDRGPTTIFR